jgi:hypothetical protein
LPRRRVSSPTTSEPRPSRTTSSPSEIRWAAKTKSASCSGAASSTTTRTMSSRCSHSGAARRYAEALRPHPHCTTELLRSSSQRSTSLKSTGVSFPELSIVLASRLQGDRAGATLHWRRHVPAEDIIDIWHPGHPGHPEYDRHSPLVTALTRTGAD